MLKVSLFHVIVLFCTKKDFHTKDVSDLLDGISIYSQEEKDRVRDILLSQMKKYVYLFDEK